MPISVLGEGKLRVRDPVTVVIGETTERAYVWYVNAVEFVFGGEWVHHRHISPRHLVEPYAIRRLADEGVTWCRSHDPRMMAALQAAMVLTDLNAAGA